MDGANTKPKSGYNRRVTLELLGALLFFSLAVLIQEIVAQDLAGPTQVDPVEAKATSRTETDPRHTE